jgi:hypothetical protein
MLRASVSPHYAQTLARLDPTGEILETRKKGELTISQAFRALEVGGIEVPGVFTTDMASRQGKAVRAFLRLSVPARRVQRHLRPYGGRNLVSKWRPNERTAPEILRDLGLDGLYQRRRRHGLPTRYNKASGRGDPS